MKKNLYLIQIFIGLLFFSACGPEPRHATAPHKPFLPAGHAPGTLELQGEYDSSASVFAMFFYPTKEELKERLGLPTLEDAHAEQESIGFKVGTHSLNLNDIYLVYTENKNNLFQAKAEWKNRISTFKVAEQATLREKLKNSSELEAAELQALLQSYPDSAGKIPEACSDLRKAPWNSRTKFNECRDKDKQIKDKFAHERVTTQEALDHIAIEFQENPENKKLAEEIESLQTSFDKLNGEMSKSITDELEMITEAVDFNRNTPSTYRNWIQSTSKNNQILEKDGKFEIVLSLRINNLLDNEQNEELFYRSTGENAEIFDIQSYLEYGTPTLAFKFYEKKFLPNSTTDTKEEVLKDHYFEVKLRRGYTSYGIVYEGEVFKKSLDGSILRRGMMKVINLKKESAEEAYL